MERYNFPLPYSEPSLTTTDDIRKLTTIVGELVPLAKQSSIEGFMKNPKNAEKLGGLVDDVRDAMTEYQVCPLSSTPALVNICARRRCNKISTT